MRLLIGGALWLLAAGPARADVVVEAGVPFTAAELEAAIAARGGPDADALDIDVSWRSPDRLVLVTSAGRREIAIGRASSLTAARVVALHVLDLQMAVAPVAEPRVAASPTADVPPSAPLPATGGYRIAVRWIGSQGVRTGDFTLVGGAIEVTRGRPWIVGGGISSQHGLTIDRAPALPVSADLICGRVVAGRVLGPLEVVAGGFAGAAFIDGGSGRITGWMTGLAAEARVVVPLSRAWSLELAASAALFRERIEVRYGDTRIGATPRATLGAGLGLAWSRGPAS